jgi:hypothetical protein
MSVENWLWGAPRIHGELLKLGFAVAQSTVAKYMASNGGPRGQNWGSFLRNHMPHIAAMDLFVVPTISFNLLYVLVIVRLARRALKHFPGMRPRAISSAIEIGSTVLRSRADYEPWVSATSPLRRARRGRTASWNG